MATSSKHKKRNRPRSAEAIKERRTAFTILAASLLASVAMAAYVASNPNIPIDGQGCRQDMPIPEAHTIVLIDQTDNLSEVQIEYLRQLILIEYLRLGRFGKFSVVGLESEDDSDRERNEQLPDFSRCRVQSGLEADELIQNPRMVAENFSKLVGEGLSKLISGLSVQREARNSPILEEIDFLIMRPDFGPQSNRRLVLVSDMLQHGPNSKSVSFYRQTRDEWMNKEVRARNSLVGMDVRVHLVDRDGQCREQLDFWENYFAGSGANPPEFGWGLPVSGGENGDVLIRPHLPVCLDRMAERSAVEKSVPETSQILQRRGFANVRIEPRVSSGIRRRVNFPYQFLVIGSAPASDQSGYIWLQVVLDDGEEGYVRSDVTSTPLK